MFFFSVYNFCNIDLFVADTKDTTVIFIVRFSLRVLRIKVAIPVH